MEYLRNEVSMDTMRGVDAFNTQIDWIKNGMSMRNQNAQYHQSLLYNEQSTYRNITIAINLKSKETQ